jgi:hypothetical protein
MLTHLEKEYINIFSRRLVLIRNSRKRKYYQKSGNISLQLNQMAIYPAAAAAAAED